MKEISMFAHGAGMTYPSQTKEAYRLAKQKQRQRQAALLAQVNAILTPLGLTHDSLLKGIVDGSVKILIVPDSPTISI